MLARNATSINERLPEDAVVLDIGGGAVPFPRADWVIDLLPYEERGARLSAERFSAQTWIARDICDREPYPFEDDEIDYVVCSHTLEDVRDPLWVCSEMNRVGRAGYVEVPSRLEEQSWGIQGPWAGWAHHRWLIEEDDGALEFAFKSHVMHRRRTDHFPFGFRDRLSRDERVLSLFWEGNFGYRERIFMSGQEMDKYLARFVEREMTARGERGAFSRRRLGWVLRAWARRPENHRRG